MIAFPLVNGEPVGGKCIDNRATYRQLVNTANPLQLQGWQSSSPPSITVGFSEIPFDASNVLVTLADGTELRLRPVGTRLGLPFRYVAFAVNTGQVVAAVQGVNDRGETVFTAQRTPLSGTALDLVLGPVRGLVHLPMRRVPE